MTTTNTKALLQKLIHELRTRSIQVGDFTLSSGKKSRYYIDARRTTMSAIGLELVGKLGHAAIQENAWVAELVGGLTLGADPMACAIALASRRNPPVLDAFTVRKEPKAHGTGQRIEGCFRSGARVVVVEDTLTTGASALRAGDTVREAGGVIVGVLALVDRLEGGAQAIERGGYPVHALLTVRDLGVEPS